MATPNVSRLPHLKSQLLAPPQSPGTNNDHNDIEDEESWEVRAFAEDTASGMGTIWPPRSYTCSFCRREFKSAQALGGHMNVHRRDRARLHQTQKSLMKISNRNPNPSYPSSSSTSGGSTLLIPTQEFLVNGGLCLLYQLRNDNPNPLDHNTILSVSPYLEADNSPSFIAAFPQAKYPYSVTKNNHQISSKRKPSLNRYYHKNSLTGEGHESGQHNTGELDLELRLGRGPTTPS
ncbi:unnamed protein product [Rhodiola kirilowii]